MKNRFTHLKLMALTAWAAMSETKHKIEGQKNGQVGFFMVLLLKKFRFVLLGG